MISTSAATRVWDVPTRLFHWLLVALFALSWWSAENGEMDRHRLSGIILLGLLLFRVVWGFIGGSTARFSGFVKGPGAAMAYLRGAQPRAGHNPLGGYAVLGLLLLIAAQIGTGLFAVDTDGIESGHLSHLVSFDAGREAAEFHELSFNVLLALIGLHIAAIVFYRLVKRRNLVKPMLTGSDAELPAGTPGLIPAAPWKLVLAVAAAAALAWWTGQGFGT